MFSKKDLYQQKWSKNIPWIEKYRPMTITDVIYQKEVVKTLKQCIKNDNLSHLLFYGPPGTGKTSTILASAKDIYTPEKYKECVLELNASDERGINIIRTKVKLFSQKVVSHQHKFKLIILDEADSMTIEAQSVLRHIIEKYSSITRFCIICNYIDKIIEPIISRCNKYRFYILDQPSIVTVLKKISKKEQINPPIDILNYIYKISNGDLRQAITILQSVYYMYGNNFTIESINYIVGTIDDEIIDEYIEILKSKNHLEIDNFCKKIYNDSYCNFIIIKQIFQKLLDAEWITDNKKKDIMKLINTIHINLISKTNFYLSFIHMSYHISSIF